MKGIAMLVRNSLLYLLARGVPALVNLAALAVFTRLLPPREYGVYALVLAIVSFASAILFRWLDLGLLRYLARFEATRARFLSTLLAGFGTIALATLALGLGSVLLQVDGPLDGLLVPTLILLLLWAFFELTLQLRVADANPRAYGLLAAGKAILALAFGTLLVAWGQGAAGIVWGYSLAMLTTLLLFARQDWRGTGARLVDLTLFPQLLRYGLPLTASFALALVVSSSDRLLLGWLRGTESVGLYAAGYDLPNQALGMLMMTVNLAAYPLVVRALEQRGADAARQQLRKHALLLLGIALPATAGLMLLATPLADLILGYEFRATAARLIPLIALAALLAGIKAFYFDLAFQLGQYTLGQVWVLLASALLNLVLNLLLIPEFGVFGAAWATLAAYGLGLALSIVTGRRHFPLPFPVADSLRILAATACMAVTLWPLQALSGIAGLATAILAGLLAYALAALILDIGGIRTHLTLRLKRG